MTQRAPDSVRTVLERVLVMLLDSLTAVATPVRVSLFVGRDRSAVLVAEAARDDDRTTSQSSLASTDWPLEVNHEPIGSLRFTIPDAAHEPGSTAAALAAITTQLEREEPRVMDLVGGLALLGALAAYFHDTAETRRRRRAA